MAVVDVVPTRLAVQRALAEQVRPVTLAEQRLLPVVAPLVPLLPHGGLPRGSVVGVEGDTGPSLALALVAEASGQGSWVAVVGLPDLGLVAAAELGVALDRIAVVPRPGVGTWAVVVAALLDAFDVVVLGPPPRARAGDARRLAARARERGAVLVPLGPPGAWPECPDLCVRAGPGRWSGLGRGHGHLRARRVRVEVTGRRGADRPRRAELWLPAAGGGIAPVDHPAARTLRAVG